MQAGRPPAWTPSSSPPATVTSTKIPRCPAPQLLVVPGDFPIDPDHLVNEEGNVIVTDTPPLPTTNDQCKNSGWKTLGVFKTQGDCVSFVATGGKNPPA